MTACEQVCSAPSNSSAACQACPCPPRPVDASTTRCWSRAFSRNRPACGESWLMLVLITAMTIRSVVRRACQPEMVAQSGAGVFLAEQTEILQARDDQADEAFQAAWHIRRL